jgi:ABC-type nitrate/sulfonate/bicarbonate transport system permease component
VRPASLALLGLAFMIVLWGLAYRLSVYQNLRSPSSQATAARLWSESRRDSVAPIARRHVSPDLIAGCVAPGCILAAPSLDSAVLTGDPLRATASPVRLLPSRGPPTHLLA